MTDETSTTPSEPQGGTGQTESHVTEAQGQRSLMGKSLLGSGAQEFPMDVQMAATDPAGGAEPAAAAPAAAAAQPQAGASDGSGAQGS